MRSARARAGIWRAGDLVAGAGGVVPDWDGFRARVREQERIVRQARAGVAACAREAVVGGQAGGFELEGAGPEFYARYAGG